MFIKGSLQSLRASRDCLRSFHLGLCLTDKCLFYHRLHFLKKKKEMKKRQESLVFFLFWRRRAEGCCRHATRLDCWFPFLIWILVLVLWSRCCCLQILQRLSPCRGLQWWVCGAIGLSAQNPGGLWFVLVQEWSQTPGVETNWNSFFTSSYASSGCKGKNGDWTLAPSV